MRSDFRVGRLVLRAEGRVFTVYDLIVQCLAFNVDILAFISEGWTFSFQGPAYRLYGSRLRGEGRGLVLRFFVMKSLGLIIQGSRVFSHPLNRSCGCRTAQTLSHRKCLLSRFVIVKSLPNPPTYPLSSLI